MTDVTQTQYDGVNAYAADGEHIPYSEKKCYERKKCTEKEKWIVKRAKELVEAYDGYPEWDCNHVHGYQDCDFDETDIRIDYEDYTVEVSLYHVDSGCVIFETLDLNSLEEDYYEEVESNFLYNVKGFKEDIIYYLDEYIKGCEEDFIERVKIDEEEEDFNQDMAIASFIELMKAGFTNWLKKQDKDYVE